MKCLLNLIYITTSEFEFDFEFDNKLSISQWGCFNCWVFFVPEKRKEKLIIIELKHLQCEIIYMSGKTHIPNELGIKQEKIKFEIAKKWSWT